MGLVYYYCEDCKKRYDSSIIAAIHAIRYKDHTVHELDGDMKIEDIFS